MSSSDAEGSRRGHPGRWLTAALLVAAAFLMIKHLGPTSVGEAARRHLHRTLVRHYDDLSVTIRSGRYLPGVGLEFRDLAVGDRSGKPWVRVNRLVVQTAVNREQILAGRFSLETSRILIDGATVDSRIDPSGRPVLKRLWPPPAAGPGVPRIDVRNLRVYQHAEAAGGGGRPSRHETPLEFRCEKLALRQSGRQIESLEATGTGDVIGRWVVSASADHRGVDVRVASRDFAITRETWRRLPSSLRRWLPSAALLEVRGGLAAAIHERPDGSWNYRATVDVADGRVEHPRLPDIVRGVRGRIEITPHRWRLTGGSASLGESPVRIAATVAEPLDHPRADVRVNVDAFRIDRRLATRLPPNLYAAWDKFRINGFVDADLRWRGGWGDGSATPTIDGVVTCKGLDVAYEKFPYPVTQIVGPVRVGGGRLKASGMFARVGGGQMLVNFDLPLRPSPTAPKDVKISVDEPLVIDADLISALSPRGGARTPLQRFCESLHPRGTVHLRSFHLSTDESGTHHRRASVAVDGGQIRYDRFPLPLYNVVGVIELDDHRVSMSGFRASDAGAGRVEMFGEYRMPPVPEGRVFFGDQRPAAPSRLTMQMDASELSMDRSLRDSLPDDPRTVWDAISPGGTLDHATVHWDQTGSAPPGMHLTVEQRDRRRGGDRPADALTDGRSTAVDFGFDHPTLTIRPPALPYRLDIVSGRVHYDGVAVRIDRIEASHDQTRLSIDGGCRLRDGRWVMTADVLGGSRIHPDPELINSCPGTMRSALRRTQLRGPVGVRGRVALALPTANDHEPIIDWDLELQLSGNRIGDAGPVRAVRGEVSVAGHRDASLLRARGDVDLDSIHLLDRQITNLRGPFRVRDEMLWFGGRAGSDPETGAAAAVDPSPAGTGGTTTPPITGRMFGGQVSTGGRVDLDSGNYDLDLSIDAAGVADLLNDFGYTGDGWTGRFGGRGRLAGNLGSRDVLRGNGSVRMTGGNIYELPMLIRFFNQFRIAPSPDVAFTDAAAEFTLLGDHVTLSSLQVWGEIIALAGGGTLDGRGMLDLTFDTRISPRNLVSRMIRPVGGKRYTLWTVDVTGSLADPVIEKTALDGVNQMFSRLAGQTEPNPPTRR